MLVNKSSGHLVLMADILLNRLERISADSPWAHQASGVRASLAKILSRGDLESHQGETLLEMGFRILEKAAGEIPGNSGDGTL